MAKHFPKGSLGHKLGYTSDDFKRPKLEDFRHVEKHIKKNGIGMSKHNALMKRIKNVKAYGEK